jgi:putative Mg2+ transporter-C (MgtC) family protein
MELLWQELHAGLPDPRQLAVVLISVIFATVLGAIVGLQREKAGKPAGLRTHMLVSLGTAVVVLACARAATEGRSTIAPLAVTSSATL